MAEAKKVAEQQATEAKKPTRKMLTPEERIKKLEADLEAARKKAAEKDAKKIDALKDKRGIQVQRVNEAQAKLKEIDDELQLLGYDVTGDNAQVDTEGYTSVELEQV